MWLGSTAWHIIRLYSPTPDQCEEVISQLKRTISMQERNGVFFSLLHLLKVLHVIMDTLNMCAVWKLATYHTPLDEGCVPTLSETFK